MDAALLTYAPPTRGTYQIYCLFCQLYLHPVKRRPGNAAWHRPFNQMFNLPTNTPA